MNFEQLRKKSFDYPIFKTEDISKWFPEAKRQTVLNQIYQWKKKNQLGEIRRGIYKISEYKIKDVFTLSNIIYSPSYLSLESALNYHGIIPDIPFEITAVSVNKTAFFETKYGNFKYYSIKPGLFFGFETIESEKKYTYNIASAEKALFDYFYLKSPKIEDSNIAKNFIENFRLNISSDFDVLKIKEWSSLVSERRKNFHNLIEVFLEIYG